jgi:hypothetical protein
MKEQEKAKAYDEALEKAVKMHRNYKGRVRAVDVVIEEVFPELKESEDERIRKELLEHCKNQAKPYIQTGNKCPQIQSWIDWLEKQGEKKDINYKDEGIVEAGKDTSVLDKIDPKFKFGDWIFIEQIDNIINGPYKIKEVNYYGYVLDNIREIVLPFTTEHCMRLWTIQDAKPGDILVNDFNIIFIFKEIKDNLCISYCYAIDRENGIVIDSLEEREVGDIDIVKFSPATKEQQDILSQKIKEEGYELDPNKLTLKKIDQDNISEDQEQAIHNAIFSLNEQEGYITKLTKMFMAGVLYEKNKNYENDLYTCGYLNGFSAGIQEAKREFKEKYYHFLTNIND